MGTGAFAVTSGDLGELSLKSAHKIKYDCLNITLLTTDGLKIFSSVW